MCRVPWVSLHCCYYVINFQCPHRKTKTADGWMRQFEVHADWLVEPGWPSFPAFPLVELFRAWVDLPIKQETPIYQKIRLIGLLHVQCRHEDLFSWFHWMNHVSSFSSCLSAQRHTDDPGRDVQLMNKDIQLLFYWFIVVDWNSMLFVLICL